MTQADKRPNPLLGKTIGIRPNFHNTKHALLGVPSTNKRANLRGKSKDKFVTVQSGHEGIKVAWTGSGGEYFVPLYLLDDLTPTNGVK